METLREQTRGQLATPWRRELPPALARLVGITIGVAIVLVCAAVAYGALYFLAREVLR